MITKNTPDEVLLKVENGWIKKIQKQTKKGNKQKKIDYFIPAKYKSSFKQGEKKKHSKFKIVIRVTWYK